MIASLNFAVAVVILGLVLVISYDHIRSHGWKHSHVFLGLTMILLASVSLVSAFVVPLGLTQYTEGFRFVTGALRGAVLVLLVAYAWYRFEQRSDER